MQKQWWALGLALALCVGPAAGQGLNGLAGVASSGSGLQPTPEALRWLLGREAGSRWAAEGWLSGLQRPALPGLWPEPELALGAGVSYALTPELRVSAGYLHGLDRQGLKPRGLSLGLGLSF